MKPDKAYEISIVYHFRRLYPNLKIEYDKKVIGALSKRSRQIDISIESHVAGLPIKIAIDCKYFNRKVDVKAIDSFIGFLNDIGFGKGALITNKGYTKGAIKKAERSYKNIELQVIDYKHLYQFNGFGAFFYREPYGAILCCPPGWIIDTKNPSNIPDMLCAFYPMGLLPQEAFSIKKYIYGNVSIKPDGKNDVDDLIKMQETNIKCNLPKCRLSYPQILSNAKDRIMKCRKLEYQTTDGTDIKELTIFIDFGKYIIYLVMIWPQIDKDNKFEALLYIASRLNPITVKKESDKIIIRSLDNTREAAIPNSIIV